MSYNDTFMIGGHLTPRQRRLLWILLAALGLAAAAILWQVLRPDWPSASFESLVVDNPALSLPAEPEGVVVLAEPGGWVRLLASDPARRLLLDPGWWQGFTEGSEGGTRPFVPAAVAAAVLDQFRQGLVVAWWEDGWIVQGRLRGASSLPKETVLSWLPEGMQGRVSVRDETLRVASSAAYAEGWVWRPPLRDPLSAGERLACWGMLAGSQWTGRWRAGVFNLHTGSRPAWQLPEAPGAALVFTSDGSAALQMAGVRPPGSGLLKGLGQQVGLALGRPCFLWVEGVEGRQPLPEVRMAIGFPWCGADSEPARQGLVRQVRSAMCPFGASIERYEDGSERWSSPLVSWWAYAGEWGVVVATGREQLVVAAEGELLGGAELRGTWWVASGAGSASSLNALSQTSLLAELGVVSERRLRRLGLVAAPLVGFSRLAWRLDGDGQELEVELR